MSRRDLNYKSVADEIRGSGLLAHLMFWLVPISIAALWLLWRDFNTNLLGFEEAQNYVNTTSGLSPVITQWALAITVQGLATVATYTFFLITPNNPTKRNVRIIVGVIAIAAVGFDVWFGYLHYIHPNAATFSMFESANWDDPTLKTYFIHALIHSIVVDTILSEVLSSWSLGLIFNLRQDYKGRIRDFRKAAEDLQKNLHEQQEKQRKSRRPAKRRSS